MKTLAIASLALLAAATAAQAAPTWEPFVIRTVSGAVTPVVPVGTSDGTAFTVVIDENGEKAGYGTDFYDGQTVGSLTSVNYQRVDAGAPDPYVNIWVTDGTNYAVIAPVANMQAGGGYTSNDVNGLDLQTLGFNIYEYTSANFDWLVSGSLRQAQGLMHGDGTPVLLSEIAGLAVNDPNPTFPQGGTGAPKNGTGFNLIFGDTQGNFVNPIPYTLANVAVPEPTAIAAIAGGAILLLGRRRRRA